MLIDASIPVVPALTLAADTGSSNADGITRVGLIQIANLESNATWQYSIDGGSSWTTGAGISFNVPQGTYPANAIQVRQTDAAGNRSASGVYSQALTVDTTPPAALNLTLLQDTGSSSSDGITNDGRLQVSGAALLEPGMSWAYSLNAGATWTTAVANTSTFSAPAGSYGPNRIQVRVTDAAGNTTTSSYANPLTVDLTAPTVPAVTLLPLGQTTYNTGFQVLTGATVTILSGTDNVTNLFSKTTTGAIDTYRPKAGAFSGTPTLSITATIADAAGNISPASPAQSASFRAADVEIVSIIDDIGPDGLTGPQQSLSSGAASNDRNLTINGRAVANQTVSIRDNGVEVATTPSGNGDWSFTFSNPLPDGNHAIQAFVGNAASSTFNVLIDTVKPDTPILTRTAAGFSVTEKSSVVVLLDGAQLEDREVLNRFTRSTSEGIDRYVLKTDAFPATNGNQPVVDIKAFTLDAAGNQSSTAMLVSQDFTAPSAVGLTINDTGVSESDGITIDGTVMVTGIEQGALWDYSLNSGQNWLKGSGNRFNVPQGNYISGAVRVRVTDPAGNSRITSLSKTLVVDLTAPSLPTLSITGNTINVDPNAAFSLSINNTQLSQENINKAFVKRDTLNAALYTLNVEGLVSLGQQFTTGGLRATATISDAAGNQAVRTLELDSSQFNQFKTAAPPAAVNNQAPNIQLGSSVVTGGVTEDGARLFASGQVVARDPGDVLRYDLVVNGSSALSTTGLYGTLVLDPVSGRWRYDLNNTSSVVQNLGASDSKTERFIVRAVDSLGATAEQEISIDVKGANESPNQLNLYNASLYRGQGPGDSAGRVAGQDPDSGSNLRYFLATGAYSHFLKIDAISGELIVSQSLNELSNLAAGNPAKLLSRYAVQIGVTDDLNIKIDANGYLVQGETAPTSALLQTFVLSVSDRLTAPTNTAPTLSARTDFTNLPTWIQDNRDRTVFVSSIKPGTSSTAITGKKVFDLFGSTGADLEFVDSNSVVDNPTLVSTLNDDKLGGIAIIGNSSTTKEGQWQYRSANSSTWTNLPTLSNQQPFILLQNDLVRFVPTSEFSGNPGALEARALDNSVIGTSQAWLRGLRPSSDPVIAGGTAAASEGTFLITSHIEAPPKNLSLKLEDAISSSGVSTTTTQGTLIGQLSVSDADTDLANIVFSLAGSNNENSAVEIQGNQLVLKTPTSDQLSDGGLRIQINATDSDGNSTATTTLIIPTSLAKLNAAPTLLSTEATLASTTQVATKPGASVATLFSPLFADSDTADQSNGIAGIAIAQNDALRTQGSWQYKEDLASTSEIWKALPSVSSARLFTLKSTSGLRFLSNSDFYGNPGGLSVYLLDQSKPVAVGSAVMDVISGARGNASASTVQLGTTITYWNKRPTDLIVDKSFAFSNQTPLASLTLTGVDGDTSSDGLYFGLVNNSSDDRAFVELSQSGQLRLKELTLEQYNSLATKGFIKLNTFVSDALNADGTPDTSRAFSKQIVVPVLSRNTAPTIKSATAAGTETPTWIDALTSQETLEQAAYLDAVEQGKGSADVAGQLISTLFGGYFSDVDAADPNAGLDGIFGGVAITSNGAAAASRVLDGTWQYKLSGTSKWISFPTNVNESNPLLLPKTASIRFMASSGFSGEPGGLSVQLLDSSNAALLTNPVIGSTQTFVIGGSSAASAQTVTLRTYIAPKLSGPTALFFKPARLQLDSNQTITATTGPLEIGQLAASDPDTTTSDLSYNVETAFGANNTNIKSKLEIIQDKLSLKTGQTLSLSDLTSLKLSISVSDGSNAELTTAIDYGTTYSATSQGYVIRALEAGRSFVPPSLKSESFSLPQTGAATNSSVSFGVSDALGDVQLSMTGTTTVDSIDSSTFRSDDPTKANKKVSAIAPVAPAMNFTLNGLTPGEIVRLEFEIPTDLVAKYAARTDASFKFDYLKTRSDGSTYNFYYDAASGTGAKIEKVAFIKDANGNAILDSDGNLAPGTFRTVLALYIQDGGRGDDDGIVNGSIIDPGVLASVGVEPPSTPTITSVTDNIGSITGILTSGGRTDDTDLTVRVSLSGTNPVAGDTIQLYDDSTALGIAYTLKDADVTAGYADVGTGTLTNGTTYAINAKLIDASGNASSASRNFITSVDTTAPAVSAASFSSITQDPKDLSPDSVTNQSPATVVFSYVGNDLSPDESFEYSIDQNSWNTIPISAINTALNTVSINGLDVAASPTVYLRLVDLAGNRSDIITSQKIIFDNVSPAVTITSVGGSDGVVSGNPSDAIVRGTAEPGQSVFLYLGSNLLGAATAGQDGSYAYQLTSDNILAIGQGRDKRIQAQQYDKAGNLGISSPFVFSLDTEILTPLAILRLDGDDAIVSSRLNDRDILGQGEPSLPVSIYAGSNLLGSTSTDQQGSFRYELTADNIRSLGQGSGKTLTAKQTDLAGNSVTSAPFSLSIDTLPPVVTITSIGGSDSTIGDSLSDRFVHGTAEAGLKVQVVYNNKVIGETNVQANGEWTFELTPHLFTIGMGSNKQISARQLDQAGNQGDSLPFNFSVNLSAPLINPISGDGRINAQEKIKGIEINGLASAGSSVVLTLGSVVREAKTASDGQWSFKFLASELPADGFYAVTLDTTDSFGVKHVITQPIIIDSSVPTAPRLDIIGSDNIISQSERAQGIIVSGVAEPLGTVRVNWAGEQRQTTSRSNGQWEIFYPADQIPRGSAQDTSGIVQSEISVVSIDAAGNESEPTRQIVTVDTQNLAPNSLELAVGTSVVVANDGTINSSEIIGQLIGSDPDGDNLTYKLDRASTFNDNNLIELTSSGQIRFRAGISQQEIDLVKQKGSLRINASAIETKPSGLSISKSFLIPVVEAGNLAPKALGTSAALSSIKEGSSASSIQGATVKNLFFSLFDAQKTDGTKPDDFSGVAIVANQSLFIQGRWQYRASVQSTWADIPLVSATQPFILLPDDYVRFLPVNAFSGIPGGLDVRLLEKTSKLRSRGYLSSSETLAIGGSGSASLELVSLTTSITAVAKGPTNLTLVAPDGVPATISSTPFGFAKAQDIDTPANLLTYRLKKATGSSNQELTTYFTINPNTGGIILQDLRGVDGQQFIRFEIEVSDPESTNAVGPTKPAVGTFTIGVQNDTNKAPLLIGSGTATLPVVSEGSTAHQGSSVVDLFRTRFSDTAAPGQAEQRLGGIAITANGSTLAQGVWQYKAATASSWSRFPTVSSELPLILSADTLVRFLPRLGFVGQPGALSLRLLDNSRDWTNGLAPANTVVVGGSGAATVDSLDLSIQIAPLPKGPDSLTLLSSSVLEKADLPGSVIGKLVATDADTPSSDLRFSLISDASTDQSLLSIQADGTIKLADNVDLQQLQVVRNRGHLRFKAQVKDPSGLAKESLFILAAENNLNTAPIFIPQNKELPDWAPVATESILQNRIYFYESKNTAVEQGASSTSHVGKSVADLFGRSTIFSDTASADNLSSQFGGIAVVSNLAAANPLDGRWEYDSTGNGAWVAFPVVSELKPLLLLGSTKIRFKGSSLFSGTPGSLEVRLLDNSLTFNNGLLPDPLANPLVVGGSGAASSQKVELLSYVRASEKPPENVYFLPARSILTQDGVIAAGTILGTLFGIDKDTAASELRYEITSHNSETVRNKIDIANNTQIVAKQGLTQAELLNFKFKVATWEQGKKLININGVNRFDQYFESPKEYGFSAATFTSTQDTTIRTDSLALPSLAESSSQPIYFSATGLTSDITVSASALAASDLVGFSAEQLGLSLAGNQELTGITPLSPLLDFSLDTPNPGDVVRFEFELPSLNATDLALVKYLKNFADGSFSVYDYQTDAFGISTGARLETKDSTGGYQALDLSSFVAGAGRPAYLAVYVQDNGRGDSDVNLGRIRDPGTIASFGIRTVALALDRNSDPINMTLALTDDPNGDGLSTIPFVVNRSALYDNVVNYYKLSNPATGEVSVGGVSKLPADAGYLQLATDLTNILTSTAGQRPNFATADLTETLSNISFTGSNTTWVPYVYVNNTGLTYTPYAAANPDRYAHFQHARDADGFNYLFVEDLPGGGDADFNDIIIRIGKAV